MQSQKSELSSDPALVAILLTVIVFLNPIKLFVYTLTTLSLYVFLCVTGIEVKIVIPNMEAKAVELLAALKNINQSIEAKTAHLASIKSDIKQRNVPEGAVSPLFESLRYSIGSQHFSLLCAGFSTLGHFLKRLLIQDQHDLVSAHARYLYPLLLERLGDHKERVRVQAAQAFTELWPAASSEVEHYVLENALVGKSPRAREMALTWLCNVSGPYVVLLMGLTAPCR